MKREGFSLLEFDPKLNKLSKKKRLRDGLSAVVQIGDTLWVTNDEMISLERLSLQKRNTDGTYKYGNHEQFALNDYIRLPMPPPSNPEDRENIEEIDVEGLDYKDGYLWLVGSHSLVRKKPDDHDSVEDNLNSLAKVTRDGNRFLLARIPLVKEMYTLEKEVTQGGKKHTAAQLHGDHKGNDLTEALKKDEHFGAFLSIPSKDNGFDIEGLAVGGERVFVGLRGPVLRGWATILELELEEQGVSTLKLKKIGPGDQPYRKHFLQLGDLGIRDLCIQGPNVLILVGPTMNLDGPVFIFRWPGGAKPYKESVISADSLLKVMHVPYGQGEDHAEGVTLFSPDGEANSVLVVYDSAAKGRQVGINGVEADIFALPG